MTHFKDIFTLTNEQFEAAALDLFQYQAQYNAVYKQYIHLLNIDPSAVKSLYDIPFLPVELFKNHTIISSELPIQTIFSSSGTTGSHTSRHYVSDLSLYEQSFERCFQLFYGDIRQYAVLALLPAYLERSGSSLVYMANKLINDSQHPQSGFYLYDYDRLAHTLSDLESQQQATILLGVTFALLDFAEQYTLPLTHTTIIETGGMKGKRREMIRPEVHHTLQHAFQQTAIHSEYGMTELLSQAYSVGNGIFSCPPWMRILLRDVYVPTATLPQPTPKHPSKGAINVIDLANRHSCAFIATADLGQLFHNHTFEVLGRMDNSDVRGCNLLIE
jgi:phenylacetate-coenzyme A ligase PaaK-like adenylate-forming protein